MEKPVSRIFVEIPVFYNLNCLRNPQRWNFMTEPKKILIAMSGGVDSSVAAALYVRGGYEVAGATMKLLPDAACGDDAAQCCSFTGVRDAKRVCDVLGIPHYTVNVVDVFKERVIDNYISEYRAGRTPNPCVACNRFAKFDYLAAYAKRLGFDAVATGHYAVMQDGVLYKGADAAKDQSYFLWVVYGADSSRILFPLFDLEKTEVRRIADELGLPTARKKESQDLCFVEQIPADAFADDVPGSIVDIQGKRIGTHSGIHNYTIGQRKGLGPLGRPMFVKKILMAENVIVAADDDQLGSSGVIVQDLLWCPGEKPREGRYTVKVRYRSVDVGCRIEWIGESDTDSVKVTFDEDLRAPAAGQSAVFYDGQRVAGGGIIESVLDSD